jgi:hypothetical protein
MRYAQLPHGSPKLRDDRHSEDAAVLTLRCVDGIATRDVRVYYPAG